MRKHSKNSSNKFMSSSHDSLSERQAILFSFKEIRLKEGIASDNADSHEIDKSSEMTIASFRDSACAFKLTGLKDGRINSCKSDKGFVGGEVADIAYFSEESSPCSISDTVNGSNDFHLLNGNRLTELREDAGDIIQLLHEVKERRDFLRKDEFLSEAIGSYGAFGSPDNILSADRDLSAFAAALKCLCNNLSFSGSDKASRGELLEEQKHGSSKDITDRLQFRKYALQDAFDLVFSRSDEMRDGFPFSGNIPEVFSVLRDGELLDGILVNKDELGDSERVFPVGFGLTQGQLSEIRDQKGINDNSIGAFVREEGKEIDMVAASGLHSSHDSGEVFTVRSNSPHQFGEPVFIHRSRKGKTDIAFTVKTCSRERILGNINTDEQLTQSSTSIENYLDRAGEASRPILHDDKDSMIQSTYYGYGRQGTDSFEGSMTQVIWSSPACPTLTGKTRLYKRYNTNSM